MNIELILSIAGILIAAGGIIYTYTVSNRVDRQNIIINDDTITKSKQANFTAGIESYQKMTSNGRVNTIHELEILNTGEKPAKNFLIETTNGGEYLNFPAGMFPISVFQPGQKLSFNVLVYMGSPNFFDLKFKWDDEFQKDRVMDYTVKVR